MSEDPEWTCMLYHSPEVASKIAGSFINYRNVPRGGTPRINQVINAEGVIRLTLHINDQQEQVKVPVGSLIYRNRYDDIVLVGAMIEGSWQPYPIAAAGNLIAEDIQAVIKRVKDAYDKVEGFRDQHLKALVAAGHDWQNSHELQIRRRKEDIDTSKYQQEYDISIKPALANPLVGTSTEGWTIPFGQPAAPISVNEPVKFKMFNLQYESDRSKLAQYHKLEQKPTTHYQALHLITEIFSKAMVQYLQDNRISASDWHQDRFRAVGRLGLPAIIDEFQDVSAITVLINQNTEHTGIPKGIRVTIRLERNGNPAQSTEYTTVQSYV